MVRLPWGDYIAGAVAGVQGETFPPVLNRGTGACSARTCAPALLSPSTLKTLRACPESLEGEKGTEGVRVPLWGGAADAESSLGMNR